MIMNSGNYSLQTATFLPEPGAIALAVGRRPREFSCMTYFLRGSFPGQERPALTLES